MKRKMTLWKWIRMFLRREVYVRHEVTITGDLAMLAESPKAEAKE